MIRAILLILLVSNTHADEITWLSSEPQIIPVAKWCHEQNKLTDEEMRKVMTLPLHNVNISSHDYCGELRKALKPMKPWYQ